MYLSRKSLLPLALVVGLFGTPTLTQAHVPGASGGLAHPPAVQLAAAEPRTRRQRQTRGAKVRVVLRRAVGGVRGAVTRIGAAGGGPPSRRPSHEPVARGPPRS